MGVVKLQSSHFLITVSLKLFTTLLMQNSSDVPDTKPRQSWLSCMTSFSRIGQCFMAFIVRSVSHRNVPKMLHVLIKDACRYILNIAGLS
jgi:hypothetical protein